MPRKKFVSHSGARENKEARRKRARAERIRIQASKTATIDAKVFEGWAGPEMRLTPNEVAQLEEALDG